MAGQLTPEQKEWIEENKKHVDWLREARMAYPKAPENPPSYEDFQNLRAVVGSLINYLELQERQHTTGSSMRASEWAAPEQESTGQEIQPLSLQPGDQMVADLFHVAHCSECAQDFAVLMAKCRTHALAVVGTRSTSQKPDSTPSAQEPAVAASQSSTSSEIAYHDRFREICEEMIALHERKGADYGGENDPYANVRASQGFGVPPWVGALVRLNDKIVRIQSFIRNGKLVNESLEDSIQDIAVYAVIMRILYDETAK